MFKKVEQNGQIKFTNHSPGDYFVEPNPKRQKLPDFKRIIVKAVVDGLKVKIQPSPARVVKFDLVERPQGYQAIAPFPRKLTSMAPVVQASQMLQAARLEKLQIDAPEKTNTAFWRVYDTWTNKTRIAVLNEAIRAGAVINLVPIEINPLTISKWDWAVWFLGAMVTSKLIKKYQQTTFILLKLFFDTAEADAVAQMTHGLGPTLVRGWKFDEFSIVRRACQQLELPRQPEQYGYEAPYMVYPREFPDKAVSILLYLTANSDHDLPGHICSYKGTLLDFTQVKNLMREPTKKLNMLLRIIEDHTPAVEPGYDEGDEPGYDDGEGDEGDWDPEDMPALEEVNVEPKAEGEPKGEPDPDRPAADHPDPHDPLLGVKPIEQEADADFYPWEIMLENRMSRITMWAGDYGDREETRTRHLNTWYEDLFHLRIDPQAYHGWVGQSGVRRMARKIMRVHQESAKHTEASLQEAVVQTLHGSRRQDPSIQTGNYHPLTTRRVQQIRKEAAYIEAIKEWVEILGGRKAIPPSRAATPTPAEEEEAPEPTNPTGPGSHGGY